MPRFESSCLIILYLIDMKFSCLCKYDVSIVVLTVWEKPIICLGMNKLRSLHDMVVTKQISNCDGEIGLPFNVTYNYIVVNDLD